NNQIENLAAVFNDEYDTPSYTKKVFASMIRKGKDFSRTVTPLFPSMLASQAVEGKGSGQPTEPQHIPTTASPSHVDPIPTIASSSHPKKTHKCRKTKSKVTEIPQSSEPTNLDADKTVHEERGDSVEKAATTAASLDAECQEAMGDTIAQTRSEKVSTPSYDSPLLGVNTPGSDEERIKLKELMDMYTKLSDRVLDLENVKDAQALEIKKLKKRVKKLEKKKKSRTPQPKRRVYKPRVESSEENLETQGRFGHDIGINTGSTSITTASINITTVELVTTASAPVTTAGVSVSTAEPSTPPTTTTLIEDEDLTIAQTLMKMKSEKSREKSKEKGVSSETATRPTRGVIMKEATMIEADYELAQRLQAEEQGELTIEERSKLFIELMDKKKKHFAKLRAEEIRRKPPTKAQKRNQMCTYLKNMANYKHGQLKNKSFEEIQMLFDNTMKWVDSFVLMDSEVVEGSKSHTEGSKNRTRKKLDEESVKRQKLEDDAKKAELKLCLEIVPRDAMAGGSTKYYKIFSAMLDDFDRQDVLDLYRRVNGNI
ncbi:hypothetical protein Tco_0921029, partial [Tanacetum coccineum]